MNENGMEMRRVLDFDTALFRWVNGHHAPLLDWLLWTASQPWSWAAVLLAAYAWVLWRARHQGGGARPWGWLLLAGMALCFALSDQVSVHGFKEVFQRPRPCHALEGVRMFRTRCGGQYGFVSSHAANACSVALFWGLCALRICPRGARGRWLPLAALLAWAAVVGYSRPYLGKHYPGDVACGALLGLAVGAAVYWMASAILRRISSKRLA